ncbi:MAG TPA: CDP-alcohol phosphatidyltransferase family protein [Candidatus Angelobacter sp.]
MIKTVALLALAVRCLLSNRRSALAGVLLQAWVHARLWARRARSGWKLRIPAVMVSFRAALGPVVLLVSLARSPSAGAFLAALIVMALLSDIYDGVLARLWDVDTEDLRRWDTRADTFFYLCVLIAVLVRHPAAVLERWPLIVALLAAEAAQHLFSLFKYGRHASYHSVLSKIWGLLMAAAMISLLGFDLDGWFIDLTLRWGILCNLQGTVMTLLLPAWHRDVPSLFHALRLRSDALRQARQTTLAPSRAWW